MDIQEVKHYQINGKYSIKITKAAGVKTGLGYEIEAHGDDSGEVVESINWLKKHAEELTPAPAIEVKEGK